MKNSKENYLNAYTASEFHTAVKPLSKFFACLIGTIALCLTSYTLIVDRLVPTSKVPGTYKWFLLKEIPGPRVIFESGSNSHHGINTETVGAALGMTAINIADNAGYPLEDKITRLENFTRPGDIVVLPLEWTHYHREKMTDNYVETLFTENRDYYRSMPTLKRVKRALSLPPEKVISEISKRKSRPPLLTESPAMELYVAALTHPTGHSSREVPSGPGLGVAEQSCDDYILGKAPVRKTLSMGANIKPALARLQKLKARGVNIHFSWPVLAGEGCMMANSYVTGFRAEIEEAINHAGFEFLGAPSQSVYGQEFQDDTPYHLIQKGAEIHTQKIINFLKAQGYGATGTPFDITTFARHRLLELELADVEPIKQPSLPIGELIKMEDQHSRPYVDFAAGWWAFEPYGRWMRDNRAMFRVTLPDELPENAVMKIQGRTLSGKAQRVTASVDGRVISSQLFNNTTPLLIPVSELPRGETVSIFLELPEADIPQSPLQRGENQDARSMTVHLQNLELTVQNEPMSQIPVAAHVTVPQTDNFSTAAPVVQVNAVTQYTKHTASNVPLLHCLPVAKTQSHILSSSFTFTQGWWDHEPTGRWIKGRQANFDLALPTNKISSAPSLYKLTIRGDFFMGELHPISAVIDGKDVGTFHPHADGSLSVSFEASTFNSRADVSLELKGKINKSPKALGFSQDDRSLTFFLKSVELTEV